MAHNVYECMFILNPNQYSRDPAGVAGQIPAIIQKLGGEVLADRLWNEQKLAYPINGHRKGTYWLTYFRIDGRKISQFREACRLNESILRSLCLKVEPRLVEALVAHARGERPLTKPEGGAAEKTEAEGEGAEGEATEE